MFWNLCARDNCANMADGRSGDYCSIRCEENLEGLPHMTAFEVPIYPEEYPMIGIPVQYPPKIASNALYGKRDQAIDGDRTDHSPCPNPDCCPPDRKDSTHE